MAASWDTSIVERAQTVAAREARSVGIHWTFAPMVDVARDPRWGRMIEGAGEDPYLGAAIGAAQVRGFQGAGIGTAEHIVAGPKHFAGYGAALGGRDYDEVNLSDAELWNVYFPPFRAAIAAGAGNVMTAYMDLNGIPASGNRWLFHDVLREQWGFRGFVVSDANAVRSLVTHGFAADLADAAARAVNVGVDLEMAIADPAYACLPDALDAGAVTEAALDTCVRRILEVKLRLGLLDDPFVDEDAARIVLADPAHRAVAREAAQRSVVLLRNERGLLPLDTSSLTSIAVLGPLAASPRDTLGPWCFDHDLTETVTVLDGIRTHLGDAVRVDTRPACVRCSAPSRPSSTCSPATAPRSRRDSTTSLSWPVPSSSLAVLTSPSWSSASGRTRSERMRPGPRSSCPVGSWNCSTRCTLPASPSSFSSWAPGRLTCAGPPTTCRRFSTSGIRARKAVPPSPTCCSARSRRAGSCRSRGRAPSDRCR
jgi:beta-glucosidase